MTKKFDGIERRQFVRFDFVNPLAFKVCKKKTVTQLLDGYTSNVSRGGLRCNIKQCIPKNSILWLSFDRGLLEVCRNIENKCLIYQNGILGKVVWSKKRVNSAYDIGVRFITREEKNLTHIYPKIYFMPEFKKARQGQI